MRPFLNLSPFSLISLPPLPFQIGLVQMYASMLILEGEFLHLKYILSVGTGVNISQKWDKLFPDENGQKEQTLPYSLSKSCRKVNFSRMVYPGMLKNIHPSVWVVVGGCVRDALEKKHVLFSDIDQTTS